MTGGMERMPDAALSRKLGHYQKMAAVWRLVGLAGAVGGVIAFFAVQGTALRAVLTAALFFGGICCAVFLGGGAQKKLKALLREQLGDFFRAELEKAFGPDLRSPALGIDEPFLKTLSLAEGAWEESEVENLRGGVYRGVRFTAANVRLRHVYRRGAPHEGYETCSEEVFRGLILRCETREGAPVPRLAEWVQTLGRQIEGKVCDLRWEGGVLTLALETDYGFAAVAGSVDLRDLDAARESYRRSLRELAGVLDLLLENTALFAAGTER